MRKLIRNKHFISFIGLAIICTSLFLLLASKDNSQAQTSPLSLQCTQAIPYLATSIPCSQMPFVSKTAYFTIFKDSSVTYMSDPSLFVVRIKDAASGNQVAELPAHFDTANNYLSASWDTSQYLTGRFSATAYYKMNTAAEPSSNETVFAVQNEALNIYFVGLDNNPVLKDSVGIRAQSNKEGASVYFSLFDSAGAEKDKIIATPQDRIYYLATLDTKKYDNGSYALVAYASLNGESINRKATFTINNPEYSVKVLSPLNNEKTSGTIVFKASTTPANAGNLYFKIANNIFNKEIPASFSAVANEYHAQFDTNGLDNGSYSVSAYFNQSGTIIQDHINIYVANAAPAPTTSTNNDTSTSQTIYQAASPAPAPAPTPAPTPASTPAATTSATQTTSQTPNAGANSDAQVQTAAPIQQPLVTKTVNQIAPINAPAVAPTLNFTSQESTIYPDASLSIYTNTKPLSVDFYVYDIYNSVKDHRAGTESAPNYFRYNWPSRLAYGKYRIVAIAKFGDGSQKRVSIDVSYKPSIEIVPKAAPIQQPLVTKTVNQIAPYPSTSAPKPVQPQASQTLAPAPARVIQDAPNPECLKINIKDFNACQNYLALPYPCKQNKILDRSACNTYLNLPLKCQDKGYTDPLKCQAFLQSSTLPAACQKANIIDQNQCREYIQNSSLASECVQAGLEDYSSCQSYLASSSQAAADRSKCDEINLKDEKLCDSYLAWSRINPECESVLITNPSECRAYLMNSFGMKICKDAGISEKQECEGFIFNNILNESGCRDNNDWNCVKTINENLGTYASVQTKFEQLEKAAKSNSRTTSVKEVKEQIGNIDNFLPIKDAEQKIKLVKTKKQLIISNKFIQTSPVAIMIDSDSDGLSDDMEKRIGTSPNDKDTDKDGFDDFSEYKNGYNPKGPGKAKDPKFSPIDEAIINNRPIEHPKATTTVDTRLAITDLEKSQNTIKGQAIPGQVYTLFIYSDLPVMTTVETDEFGNWQYRFQNSIVDGQHEVYLALNDNTGKVVSQSKPFNFFIKEAKAVTANDFVSTAIIQKKDRTKDMLFFYLIVASFSVIIGIGTFVVYLKYYKRNIA